MAQFVSIFDRRGPYSIFYCLCLTNIYFMHIIVIGTPDDNPIILSVFGPSPVLVDIIEMGKGLNDALFGRVI